MEKNMTKILKRNHFLPALRRLALALVSAVLSAAAASAADTLPAARFKGTGKADPIRVTNVAWKTDAAAGNTAVTFDLAWDWSWRAAWEEPAERTGGKGTLKLESWDAAWVFVKFREPGADGYRHATLDTDGAHHTAPAGAKLDVGLSDDPSTGLPSTGLGAGGAGRKRGMGAFVYRAATSSGPNAWKGVTLRWRHGADGVDDPGAAGIKVFAIQMVYVPTCPFWAGDSSPHTMGQVSAGDTTDPLLIRSEEALTLGGRDRNGLGTRNSIGPRFADDFSISVTQTLPARFPKGYAGFYCMRQEITQGQYVEFLNTLTYDEQARAIKGVHASGGKEPNAPAGTLVGTVIQGSSYRNRVKIVTPGAPNPTSRVVARADGVAASVSPTATPAVFTTDAPHLPHGMCYSHQIALTPCLLFSAWAGLRPMTELEYEKACRGPLKPVPGEFAWGTAGIAGTNKREGPRDGYALRNAGQADESVVWEGANGPDAERGNAAWGGTTLDMRSDRCYAINPINGPLRGGLFATPDSDRVAAGASYWGILDLTGSLYEEVICPGNVAGPWREHRGRGRGFAGEHGDGTLNLPTAWEYRVQRGGSYDSRVVWRVSDRRLFSHGTSSMRGVRSAP
jgi:hypothetical protein